MTLTRVLQYARDYEGKSNFISLEESTRLPNQKYWTNFGAHENNSSYNSCCIKKKQLTALTVNAREKKATNFIKLLLCWYWDSTKHSLCHTQITKYYPKITCNSWNMRSGVLLLKNRWSLKRPCSFSSYELARWREAVIIATRSKYSWSGNVVKFRLTASKSLVISFF